MESSDYYSLLGVSRSATHQEIRSAYLEQAAFFRPDAGNVSPEIAQSKSDQLDEAYAVLSSVARKRKYDAALGKDKKYFIVDTETGEVVGEAKRPRTPKRRLQLRKNPKVPVNLRRVFRIATAPILPVSFCGIVLFTLLQNSNDAIHTSSTATPAPTFASALTTPLPVYTYAPAPSIGPLSTMPPHITMMPSLPPVVPVTSGEIIKAPLDEGVAPFTVETSAGKNYYIYLKYLPLDEPSGLLSLINSVSFYVEGGKTEKVYVPLGEYEVYYATGNTWYGPSEKFGNLTRAYLCDGTFIFSVNDYYYDGWTVTLYPVFDGNMDTDEIPLDLFGNPRTQC